METITPGLIPPSKRRGDSKGAVQRLLPFRAFEGGKVRGKWIRASNLENVLTRQFRFWILRGPRFLGCLLALGILRTRVVGFGVCLRVSRRV